jgi:tRNA A-37 threonylcarbamoyl transferase component Bud32
MFQNYYNYINNYNYYYNIIRSNPNQQLNKPKINTLENSHIPIVKNNNNTDCDKISVKESIPISIDKKIIDIKYTKNVENTQHIQNTQTITDNNKHLTCNLEDFSNIKDNQNKIINKLSSFKNTKEQLLFLSSLRPIYKFTSEHTNSDIVVLLEGYIVKKKCFANSLGNYMFWNEVKALVKLDGYPHFPKIIAYDPNSLTIYMSYCGKNISSLNLPLNWKEQVKEICEIMETLNVNSNDMLLRNVCCLNGEIKIIDFGLHTIFGKTIKENIADLINNLNSLGSISTTEVNNDYQQQYHDWKNNLQKYKIKQQQLEIYKNQLKIAYKNCINNKDKNKK